MKKFIISGIYGTHLVINLVPKNIKYSSWKKIKLPSLQAASLFINFNDGLSICNLVWFGVADPINKIRPHLPTIHREDTSYKFNQKYYIVHS